MEMCGFEILARGKSPWCDVFTRQEWSDFEYSRDLLHFYRAGPGNTYAGAMGFIWLNATQELISHEETGGAYFSFAHDGDIAAMLTALGIYNGDRPVAKKDHNAPAGIPYLPPENFVPERVWKTSDLTPMGGRVIIERLRCWKSDVMDSNAYIRVLINDGVVAIGGHPRDGLLEIAQFEQLVRERGNAVGGFRDVCGLDSEVPDRITFLHQ